MKNIIAKIRRQLALWQKRRQLQDCAETIALAVHSTNVAIVERDADKLNFAEVLRTSQERLHAQLRAELVEMESPAEVRRGVSGGDLKGVFRTVLALRDLPNREGYRFVGIDLDMQEHDCVVVKDAIGCHTVHREKDDEPFFFKLYGWREHKAA